MKPTRFKLELFETTYCNTVTNTGEYSCLKVHFKLQKHFLQNSFLRIDHIWMTLNQPTIPHYLQILMVFKREFSYYLLTIYVPSCMLVIVSWVSPRFFAYKYLYLENKSGMRQIYICRY